MWFSGNLRLGYGERFPLSPAPLTLSPAGSDNPSLPKLYRRPPGDAGPGRAYLAIPGYTRAHLGISGYPGIPGYTSALHAYKPDMSGYDRTYPRIARCIPPTELNLGPLSGPQATRSRKLLASSAEVANRQASSPGTRVERDKLTASVLSFEGCEHLLRACPLPQIMQNFGSIFANSAGSAATHALSHEVKLINDFISHNWVVDRLSKFVALIFEYNFDKAFGITCITSCALALAAGYQVIPMDPHKFESPEPSCFVGTVGVGPIFLASLTFAHRCRCRSPVVFLDKVCVSQENDALKQASDNAWPTFTAGGLPTSDPHSLLISSTQPPQTHRFTGGRGCGIIQARGGSGVAAPQM